MFCCNIFLRMMHKSATHTERIILLVGAHFVNLLHFFALRSMVVIYLRV